MTAYYNEIDPYAAQWLRNLIEAGLIAPGEVDTRSIVDVRAADLGGFGQCHFFAGFGGWSGALRLACVADTDPVWTGSCPCQPFSLAGKQKGFDDDRHLWPVWRELIRERRPAKVYGEQVASAARWLRLVRSDLEAMGYAVGAIPCEAASAGAYHLRDRFWFVGDDPRRPAAPGNGCVVDAKGFGGGTGHREDDAIEQRDGPASAGGPLSDGAHHCSRTRLEQTEQNGSRPFDARRSRTWRGRDGDVADTFGERRCGRDNQRQDAAHADASSEIGWAVGSDGKARPIKSGIRLLAHGIPARVAKLRTLGNAIDLRPAAEFIKATR